MSDAERLLESLKCLLGEAYEDAKELVEATGESEFKASLKGSASNSRAR